MSAKDPGVLPESDVPRKDLRRLDEFFVAVDPLAVELPAGRWKLTARFSLRTRDGYVPCVRLRVGVGPSYYFAAEEFERLFRTGGKP